MTDLSKFTTEELAERYQRLSGAVVLSPPNEQPPTEWELFSELQRRGCSILFEKDHIPEYVEW